RGLAASEGEAGRRVQHGRRRRRQLCEHPRTAEVDQTTSIDSRISRFSFGSRSAGNSWMGDCLLPTSSRKGSVFTRKRTKETLSPVCSELLRSASSGVSPKAVNSLSE